MLKCDPGAFFCPSLTLVGFFYECQKHQARNGKTFKSGATWQL